MWPIELWTALRVTTEEEGGAILQVRVRVRVSEL